MAKDSDFNGRWDIKGNNADGRAWWLEVTGAGTPALAGKLTGAPGGDLYQVHPITLQDGVLNFAIERAATKTQPAYRLVYTAKLVDGELRGEHIVEGRQAPKVVFTGKRAPVIKDKDDGSWKPGKPVELFNGKDLSNWSAIIAGRELGWKVEDGIMKNVAGANNLYSSQKFWNFDLHCEFRIGEGSNAGIGLRGRYEVQILDDYGKSPDTHSAGALYSRIAPSTNASRKPGEWQTYDIRLVGRQVTIVVNGVKVIDKGEVEGLTAMAHDWNEAVPGPISLQGDHKSVEIRKLTVTPLVRP